MNKNNITEDIMRMSQDIYDKYGTIRYSNYINEYDKEVFELLENKEECE